MGVWVGTRRWDQRAERQALARRRDVEKAKSLRRAIHVPLAGRGLSGVGSPAWVAAYRADIACEANLYNQFHRGCGFLRTRGPGENNRLRRAGALAAARRGSAQVPFPRLHIPTGNRCDSHLARTIIAGSTTIWFP